MICLLTAGLLGGGVGAVFAFKHDWSFFKIMWMMVIGGTVFWHSVHFLLLLASGLTLTPQGVELKRWQTTMTPSKEIQSVQTGSAYGVKTVEFVLSGRSELSRVPGHAVAIPDREFDQKL